MNFTKILFATAFLIGLHFQSSAALSDVTRLTLHQYQNFTGDSISFISKQPDLSNWKFFSGKIQSFDTSPRRYHWFGYSEVNYTGSGVYQFLENSNLSYFDDVNSIRYIGAGDVTIKAISFYQYTVYRGEEYYSETVAGSGIPFRPTALATTGGANYTLFEGTNFDGNATCFQSMDEVSGLGVVDFQIGSFVRGCDLRSGMPVVRGWGGL